MAIDIIKAIDMLNEGIKPKIKYDRNNIADLCKQGYFTSFIEFVGGVSTTTQIDLDFEKFYASNFPYPNQSVIYLCHTELQTLVRYHHRVINIQYGQKIDPYNMKTSELVRLAPQGYFNPDFLELIDSYAPPSDYYHEVTANDLLFSEKQIKNYIDVINGFEDITDTPADNDLSESKENGYLTTIGVLLELLTTPKGIDSRGKDLPAPYQSQAVIIAKIEELGIYGQKESTLETRFSKANNALEQAKKK